MHRGPREPNDSQGLTVLTLSESASRSVPADHLIARLQLEQQGEDARALQATVNRQMAAALDKARGSTDVKLEGGSYYVSASVPEPEKNSTPIWTAVQEISLSGSDPGKVLALAGELQDLDFLFSELRQDLTPERQRVERETLLQEATARLRGTADAVAKGLGLQFIGWNRVSLVGSPEPPRFRMAMAAEAMPAPSTAGAEIEVSVTIEGEARLARLP